MSSLQNICRTCMLNNSEHQSMFKKSNVKRKITQMLSMFSVPANSKKEISLVEIMKSTVPQLKIDISDKLPKVICLECSEKIKEIYSFQQNCLSVQQKFYKMLQQESNDPIGEKQVNENILKIEFNEAYENENSLQFDDDPIEADDIKVEILANEEFNASDLSDIDWNENSGSDWEEEFISKSKNSKRELSDDEIRKVFRYKDYNQLKTSTTKKTDSLKHITSKQIYPCDKCNRRLKSKLSLKKHQEMHEEKDNEERRLICNICNKVFGKSSHLKDHSRTHIGEKPFLCSECGKGFTTAGTLKQHSYRHLNKTQFPCPDCPRCFPTKTDLYSHSNIHKAMPKKKYL